MKRTKLLTSLVALALVIGLGACEETEVEQPSDDSSESVDADTTDTTTGDGGDAGDTGDTGDGSGDDGDGDDGDTGDDGNTGDGDAGDGSGDDGDGDDGDGNDGDGDTADNTETETFTVNFDFQDDYATDNDGAYTLSDGKKYEVLVSCDLTFNAATTGGTLGVTSSRIRLGVGAGVTFTPKEGHTLVEISFTYDSNQTYTTLGVNDSAASITCDTSGATITDILDGSSALTVTNTDSGNIDFTAITITYS